MIVTAGSTNVSVYFYIVQDASGTSPGEPVTGLLFSDIETGGSASYVRQGADRTDLTLVTLASASAAHTDGGFIEVDATNMPGLYRCDFPDAAFATGVDQVFLSIVVASANNAVAAPIKVDITDFDLRTANVTLAATQASYAPAKAGDNMGTVSSVTGNVDGSVASVTDKTGFSLSTAGILAIWHQAVSAIVTAGTIGKLFVDEITSARMATLTDWIDGGRLDLLLDDVPTTSEFEARTLAAAAYFDPAADTVANVATVATTTTNTDMRGTDNAALASVATEARLSELDAATAGKMANQVDVIQTDTTTDIPGLISGQNDISVADVLTTQMTEAYAADGSAPTLAQALFLIQQSLGDFTISGTTVTVKQLDGTTTAATFTLDDGSSPTGSTRAS